MKLSCQKIADFGVVAFLAMTLWITLVMLFTAISPDANPLAIHIGSAGVVVDIIVMNRIYPKFRRRP